MDNEILITQAEAAQILGRSVSTVSRCIRDGKLHYADERKRLLLRQGLEDRFRAAVRPRVDVPQVKSANPAGSRGEHPVETLQPEPIATDYWSRLDQKPEFSLGAGPVYWQQPSDPQRLRLFCRTLDELRSQVELEGLEP